jgi:hypothetical protein
LFGIVGLILMTAPWTSLWERATLVLVPSGLGGFVRSGFVRGAVSGIGALDLWIATQDASLLWRMLRTAGRTAESA